MNQYFENHENELSNEVIESNTVENNLESEVTLAPVETKIKRKSKFKTYISLILASSMVTSVLMGGFFYSKFSNDIEKLQQNSISSNTNRQISGNVIQTSLTKGAPVTEIAKKVGPSIVGIRMTFGDPQRGFVGNQSSQSAAEGSGIILSKDGYIMTNYHVVSYADPKGGTSGNTTLEVFLPDKRQAKAKFIGGDSKNDLAVIKIELDNLPVAELGDSSQLEVGEQAIAIGNPLGMEFAGSVTVGVISALNREVATEDITQNLIQTDAAINPGNSGGALVNSQGKVIGINSIKISQAGIEGLGFAIPINDVKPIVDQLILFGYVKGRPLIGISGKDITDTISKQYNLPVGIYVMDVTLGGGAEKAGIQKGDILISLADKEVKTMNSLETIKKGYKAGDTINAIVVREGKKINLKLIFTEEH